MYLFLAYSLEFPKKSFFSSTYSWQHDDAILVQVENRKVWSETSSGFREDVPHATTKFFKGNHREWAPTSDYNNHPAS